ncbi:glycosyltransferase family 39 protein [Amycolatopsis oliviviridis]|uniref:Glycosyl transferase family 39 n=1 Tax=Amycolatopsis oliviviridis TaxID=1471590 RepID=A0ABQ3M5V6_9PSEU|nr:glycosyltransferase family 39 protein [Amycolatopsis oliviviridis]GHH34110.1 glycosyl transferase family 39 [Amycolatopsis oliviviridis]
MVIETEGVRERIGGRRDAGIAPFARTPVLAIAGAMGAVLAATAGRYGYFGDELYFLAAGRHLDWGYADQPPLLPLLARLMDAFGADSPFVLRIPAMLATVAGVVLTALIARELGGGRRAQVIAAGTFAVSIQMLGGGHYLATSTLDPFLWTLVLWLLVRWTRTRADGLLLWSGVATGFALNTKFLIGAFWVVALAAAVAVGPRDLVRRPALWIGALIAAAMIAPTLVWQAANGWPQLTMGAAISQEVSEGWGGRVTFVPTLVVTAGVPVGMVLLCYGLWRLLRSERLRPYRFLGWTALGVLAVFLLANGRYYYAAGMFAPLFAAAAVEIEAGQASKYWRWIATWPVYVVAAAIAIPQTLPILPQSTLTSTPDWARPLFADEEVGWREITESVAQAYRAVPDPAGTGIVTAKYWQAGAIDHYGPELGLPSPSSPNRGYVTLPRPPESARDILFVGNDPSVLVPYFTRVREVGALDNRAGIPNVSQGMKIWLATGRTGSWDTVWPKLTDWGF